MISQDCKTSTYVEPPEGVQLHVAWPNPTPLLSDKIIEFWLREGALTCREQAQQRSRELMVIAMDRQGAIKAVSSAGRIQVGLLQRPCFFYRFYVGKQHRTFGLGSGSQLALSVFTKSYDVLNKLHLSGHFPEYAGIYMEIEDPSFRRYLNDFVWCESMLKRKRILSDDILKLGGASQLNVFYLGTTAKGSHARIWYFTDAQIATSNAR